MSESSRGPWRAIRDAVADREGGAAQIASAGPLIDGADPPADPPLERVPMLAFTAIVTEDGALAPEEAARSAARFTLHPATR